MARFVKIKREDVKKHLLKWTQAVEAQSGSGPGLFQEGRIDCFQAIPYRQRQAYLSFIYDIQHLQFLIERADLERTRKKMNDLMKKRGYKLDSYKKYSSDDNGENRGHENVSSEIRYASYRGRLRELLLGLKERIMKSRAQEANLWRQLETNAGHLASQTSFKKSRKYSLLLEEGLEQTKKIKAEDILTGKTSSKFVFNLEDNSLVALALMLTTHWNPMKTQKSVSDSSRSNSPKKVADQRVFQQKPPQATGPAAKPNRSAAPAKPTAQNKK